jgi:hypothetical protein
VTALGALDEGVYRGKLLDGIGASGLELGVGEPTARLVVPMLTEVVAARWLTRRLDAEDRARFVLCESALLRDGEATSIRSGDFVRFSNLVWLAHRIDFFRKKSHASLSLTRLLRTFASALDPAVENPTPPAIAAAFERSFANASAAAAALAAHGVSAEVAADDIDTRGRIVRLGTPSFATEPTPSALPERIARRYRELAWFFGTRFAGIASAGPPVTSVEREFAGALAAKFASLTFPIATVTTRVASAPPAPPLARWTSLGVEPLAEDVRAYLAEVG